MLLYTSEYYKLGCIGPTVIPSFCVVKPCVTEIIQMLEVVLINGMLWLGTVWVAILGVRKSRT